MTEKKKVAILGAGFSGLAAIKSCLEEGLNPTCFEQHDDLGGLWYYTEEYRDGQGARAFDSLTTNVSKDLLAYSDFPFQSDLSPFVSHSVVHEYLKSYSRTFGLEKYIVFNTRVTNVRRSRNYDVTGSWKVETYSNEDGQRSHTFDFVMVCSGFFKKAVVPDVNGVETFRGTIEHAKTYKNGVKYKNKRVVVVGNGNSSGDLASGAACFADQVFYSVGPGMWMMPRFSANCIPYDYLILTRALFWNQQKADKLIVELCRNRWDLDSLGLCPSTVPTMSRIIVNDEVPNHIMNGKIKVHGRLVRLGPNEAEFDDGSVVHDVDTVLFATGYEMCLGFLDENFKDEDGKLSLYKMIFPLQLPHNTLALIGCQEVYGPIPPILELQGRLAARVFAGKHQLPSSEAMRRDVDKWNDVLYKLYRRYKYLIPVFPYRDELAAELGVAPSWLDLLRAGPRLAYYYFYGPAFPFYERLWGPHTWPGARKAIDEALEHGYYAKQSLKSGPQRLYRRIKWVSGLLIIGGVFLSTVQLVQYYNMIA